MDGVHNPTLDKRQHSKNLMKKRSRETQTLHAGCIKAEPKIFAPPQTPFLGVQDGQNLIIWRRSLPSPTDLVWWRSMHAISSYRGNRPTNKHTTTHKTNRQDQLQYTVPLTLVCSVINKKQSEYFANVNTRQFGKVSISHAEMSAIIRLHRVS